MLYAGFDADRDYLINKFRNPVFEKAPEWIRRRSGTISFLWQNR